MDVPYPVFQIILANITYLVIRFRDTV